MLTRRAVSKLAVSPPRVIVVLTALIGGCSDPSGAARETRTLAHPSFSGPLAAQTEPDQRSPRNYRLWVRWSETRASRSRLAHGAEDNQVYAEERTGVPDYAPTSDPSPVAAVPERPIEPQGEIRGTTAARRAAPN